MTATPVLHTFQASAVARAIDAVARHPALLVAPTGSGKTVMGSEIALRRGGRVLWVAHRTELVDQAARSLLRLGLDVGVIKAGRAPNESALTQVASIQTLSRRTLPPADTVVIDEAHHAVADSYGVLFREYPHAGFLGLTATPFRLDGRGLGDVGFREIVVASTVRDLCDARDPGPFLVEPTVFAPAGPSLSDVGMVAGDFNQGQLGAAMSGPKIVGDVVTTWAERAKGRRTVLFAVNVEHSLTMLARFKAAGIAAAHIDGTTKDEERAATLRALAEHRIDVLCNCMILTEGWDLPALEVAVVARPTQSLQLHLQMLGRIMRACDGKAGALVLDHAGNYRRHGLPTRPIGYSLDGKVVQGDDDTKDCPKCGLVLSRGENPCPECGFAWGGAPPREIVEVAGRLEVVRAATADAVPFADKARFWARAYHHAQHRGNLKIAVARYREAFSEWPDHIEDRLVSPATATPADLSALELRWREVGAAIAKKKDWDPRKSDWFARKFAADKRAAYMKGRA